MDKDVSFLKTAPAQDYAEARPGIRLPWRLAIAAAALAVGAVGMYRCAKWHHAESIEQRLRAHADIIWRHAEAAALPPELIREIIRAETGARARAVSAKGAKGLMQITPPAEQEARRRANIPEGDLFDPDYNILIGTTYLRLLIDRFGGDLHLALAAYHMGPTRVEKIRKANPRLSGREIVRRGAGPATVEYCRRILGSKPMRLPTLKHRPAASASLSP
ncbi:MAG: lytic transglycosylase domain-containing protein [Planctomycetia bacterium]|nr:lytic transglycosylase domain-containing protein [Planctomycetia bacterium]